MISAAFKYEIAIMLFKKQYKKMTTKKSPNVCLIKPSVYRMQSSKRKREIVRAK
jgi:hypothetical protein